MSQTVRRPVTVDRVVHYHAISVSFTKDGQVRLGLTSFHQNPRSLVAEDLALTEGTYHGASTAAGWLIRAANLAAERLVPAEGESDLLGQLTLPLE